jgi:abortive infection bacteriophage resistance protein
MSYDKPFKTYDEQLSHLITDYKLLVNDYDFSINALKNISYYDLINGYKECMMTNGVFKENISMEFLFMFHLFDKSFQNILLKQFIFIENYFKNTLAYVLSREFGVHQSEYLSHKNYLSSKNKLLFSKVKNNISQIYNPSKSITPPQPTRHYLRNHDHIPPWILFKNISFSNAINLLSLLKQQQKQFVVDTLIPNNISYVDKGSFLIPSLNLLRVFRNKIAHNLKFVTYKASTKNALPPKILKQLFLDDLISWNDIKHNQCGVNDIYACILLIIYFLKDPYLVETFCKDLVFTISPLDNTPNEQIKTVLFNDYAAITNLPGDLASRINNYRLKLTKG